MRLISSFISLLLVSASIVLTTEAASDGSFPQENAQLRSINDWQCFHFYGQKHGKTSPKLQFKLVSKDESAKQSISVAKGSNFVSGLDFTSMDKYVCNQEKIAEGICTETSLGFLIPEILKDPKNSLQFHLNSEDKMVSYEDILDTGSYCSFVYNETPSIKSEVVIKPFYNNGIDGSETNERIAKFLSVICSFALIYYYIKQWQGKEMELDTINKSIILYFIAIECVIPLLSVLKITFDSFHWGLIGKFTNMIIVAVLVLSSTAKIGFISLLTKGYTALPKEEYPLKSSHYAMVKFSTIVYFITMIASTIQELFTIVLGLVTVAIYIYQIVQFKKTDTLLNSMSLRSSRRRSMTLRLMLFYLPLAYFILFASITIFFIAKNIQPLMILGATPEWTPAAEIFGKFFGQMIDPLIFFIILVKYWTPEAIYEDSFGFEPTIPLEREETTI